MKRNIFLNKNTNLSIVLLGFGAPDSPKAVKPFLQKLVGKNLTPARIRAVVKRYEAIGGSSPLLEIAKEQARLLQGELSSQLRCKVEVEVGMCYWQPYIAEVVRKVCKSVDFLVAISLSPHFSRITTGAYFAHFKRALAEVSTKPEVILITDWYKHPLFLDALTQKIKEVLSDLPVDKSDVYLIFSAHNIPKHYIENNDPYLREVKETVNGLITRLKGIDWTLAFQSRTREGIWLEPTLENVLKKAVKMSKRMILVAPISFVADHIETLYDLDIVFRKKVESLGLIFKRTESLNTNPLFIRALTDVIIQHLRQFLEEGKAGWGSC
jgi:ferrochelatase